VSRPPIHPGGYVAAVARCLALGPATRRQIEAATGYSRSGVEKAIHALRKAGAAEIDNLLMGESGRPPLTYEQHAMAQRTPLEQAWGARA
jgi:predicted ArsR family transcriptional regulator